MPTITDVPRMTLPELIHRFPTEEKCLAYLEHLRWGGKPVCPKCRKRDAVRVGGRDAVLRCRACNQQFTVRVGTVFHDSHLPLAKWFIAVYLLCESKKGISACQLHRMLGGSYKTAWYLFHRIRQAMMKGIGLDKLKGIVEIDDTWIGGKKPGIGRGGYRQHKSVVIGMVERGGRLQLAVLPDLTSKSIQKAVVQRISPHVDMIVSDELNAYVPALGPLYTKRYKRIKHAYTYVQGDVHTNTVEGTFSLLKRGIIGSWHHVSIKHLQRYLEEVAFRYSQRKNPALFSLTLKNLVSTGRITFKDLTAEPEEQQAA